MNVLGLLRPSERQGLGNVTSAARLHKGREIEQPPAGVHQLVLQTSEGWHGHIPKLQVAAKPLTVLSASYGDAHPTTRPRVCLPN